VRIIEWIGIGVFVLLCALGVLFARREIISRGGGTIELNVRLSARLPGRGWSPGIGRFTGDELRWYRVFSLSWRPRRILRRQALAVESRRQPTPTEALAMPDNWIVLRCTSQRDTVEIAMAESTLAGFLSWIEAAPPGAVSIGFAAR
jgi:hypothetical protein